MNSRLAQTTYQYPSKITKPEGSQLQFHHLGGWAGGTEAKAKSAWAAQ